MLNKKKKDRMFGFFVAVFLGWVSLGWIDPLADKVREGNQLYRDGKYDEALDKYVNAQINAPDAPQLDFNMADTQYKRNKYDEAARLFGKVLKSDDTGIKAESYFNMGNTLYRQGKMKEALECYKQAIDFVNETEVKSGSKRDALKNDARYNYEYVDRKMKESEQKQQGQDQKDQQQKQDKDKKDKEDQQNEGKGEDQQNKGKGEEEEKQESQKDKQEPKPENTQEENENKKDRSQSQSDKEKQKDQQPEQQQPQAQGQRQMSKEEAGRFLDALNYAEKETRLMKRDTQRLQHKSVDKDW